MSIIQDLQAYLNSRGAKLIVDGSWGPLTGKALADAILTGTCGFDLAPVRSCVAGLAPIPHDVASYYGLDETMVEPSHTRGAVTLNAYGNDWRTKNIAAYELAGGHAVRLHRKAAGAFLCAFAEVDKALLQHHDWTPGDVQSWVLRRMMWNPAKPLSFHAYGAAVDVDPEKNAYGLVGEIATKAHWLPVIFNAWGIAWGGDWNPRDDMHFEYVRR